VKTFEQQAAQGDVFFRRVDKIPDDAKPVTRKKGPLVVTHSETGHDHVFKDATGITLFERNDPFVCYLYIEEPRLLEHLRPFDTHEAILFQPGFVEVRRQREHTPQGYRRVED